MGKVLTFGELLLRISPDSAGAWLNENKLSFYPGGAEANVASALGKWGVPVSYLTAVPDNFVVRQLVNYLEKLGIDLSPTLFHGKRMGLYYLSEGKDLKHAEVVYDREDSAFAQIMPGTINWDTAFEGISWFHFSAICPALNKTLSEVCLKALEAAKKKNIRISLDLNYRAKLWQYGKEPIEVMPKLAQYCNVIMGNIWSTHKMLGIALDDTLGGKPDKEAYLRQAERTSKKLTEAFESCSIVANTFRMQENNGIRYYGTLYEDGKMYYSKEYYTEKNVHSIGTGDCFMAGLIYGLFHKHPMQEVIGFAAAAAFDKFFIEGDATTSSVEKIIESAKG